VYGGSGRAVPASVAPEDAESQPTASARKSEPSAFIHAFGLIVLPPPGDFPSWRSSAPGTMIPRLPGKASSGEAFPGSAPQLTVMMTDVLRPSSDRVAPASALVTILTWFGIVAVPTVAWGSRLKVILYWPVLLGTEVSLLIWKL